MKLRDYDVVNYLNGANTVRDGRLISLTVGQGENEWDVVLNLTFDVPRGPDGNRYELALWGVPNFSYEFSSETMLDQIAFVKCLWTDDEAFYLSLDPLEESERVPSASDGSCFRSKSASLTVSGKGR
ncbi:hypothetical protein [Sphingomonas endolithica]|uniref:hypothetical protein n=1 Tax=Sphingomonas endolithica TaxID=2972485 RepID=UPI0021AF8801|nr:hypothetical protein [Sphingomonas sp. ZFBP2030]